jgi:membrane protein implicated in regulation of membrane protease activity
MRWLRSIAREVLGLFVDDGSFAIAILAWVILAVVGLPRFAPVARWAGPALFAGLALILIESVLRFLRRMKQGRKPTGR